MQVIVHGATTNYQKARDRMNRIRKKLIKLLVGNEPIVMNMLINPALVKDDKPVVHSPHPERKISRREAKEMAVLVAMNGIEDN